MLDAQNEFNAKGQSSLVASVRAGELNALQARAKSNALNANVLFVAAGSLALISVVEIFFTDWRDDRAAFSAQPLAFAGGGGGLLVTWTR